MRFKGVEIGLSFKIIIINKDKHIRLVAIKSLVIYTIEAVMIVVSVFFFCDIPCTHCLTLEAHLEMHIGEKSNKCNQWTLEDDHHHK